MRVVVRVNMCLSSGDYSSALVLLRGAAGEFPNDAELSELEKLAANGVKRKADADRLITESQELFAQQQSAKAIRSLREAYELDKNNALARTILANALVEQAHSIVEADWWEAETLANEALALNPAHPTAKTIASRILDQKTAGSIEEWISQTRKLQSSGNLSAALSQIAEGLDVYPREPKLLQIQDEIQRDHSVQRRQARRRDLEELRRTESEINVVADDAARKVLADRIQAMATKYSVDGEILSVANGMLRRLGLIEVNQKSAPTPPDSKTAALISQALSLGAPEASRAAASVVPSRVLPGKIQPPIVPSRVVSSTVVSSSVVAPATVLAVATPGIAASSTVATSQLEPQPPAPQATGIPRSELPESAAAEAAPASTVTPPSSPAGPTAARPKKPTGSNPTALILVSAAAIIVVAAIFFFARKPPSPAVANPSTAAPTVSASSDSAPRGSAADAPAPTVSAPAPTTLEPSQPAPGVSSDTTTGKIPVDDHPLDNQLPAEVQGQSVGTLTVVAGQDNAKVFLNGKLQPQLTRAGQLRLLHLELRDYVVQVSKSGFQDPPRQKIRIGKGEQAKLVFTLQPNLPPSPRMASMTLQGGAPGTTVLVDQTLVGTVQPDGRLSVSTINPGDHIVELRKERFKPRQFKKHFEAGAALALTGPDAALEAASGELKITFAPADARVALVKDEHLTIVSSGVPLNLDAGTYTITARNADSFARTSTLEVIAGQSKNLNLSLAPSGMSKWDAPGAWKQEGDSFTRKGGDFVLYGVVPTSGTFAFSAMATKGRLLQWVLNYTDSKDYVLFQIDDNNFYRTVIRNGQKADEIIVPDKGEKKSFSTIHIRVSSTEIVHQIRHGNSWRVLDRWTQPGANLSLGKFGFYLPGGDQVALSSFTHYADLNIR
jgi:hypothetical protein